VMFSVAFYLLLLSLGSSVAVAATASSGGRNVPATSKGGYKFEASPLMKVSWSAVLTL